MGFGKHGYPAIGVIVRANRYHLVDSLDSRYIAVMIDKLIRNIPPELAHAVSEFRHEQRLPTERAAFLKLIERGLAAANAPPDEPPVRSRTHKADAALRQMGRHLPG